MLLKITEKIVRKNAFKQKKKKPGLNLTLDWALIVLRTTGPLDPKKTESWIPEWGRAGIIWSLIIFVSDRTTSEINLLTSKVNKLSSRSPNKKFFITFKNRFRSPSLNWLYKTEYGLKGIQHVHFEAFLTLGITRLRYCEVWHDNWLT